MIGICRVLFVGETESVKSTIINGLTGQNAVAIYDNDDENYGPVHHHKDGVSYEFIYSVGLDQVTSNTIELKEALKRFFAFLRDNAEGFNLIVYCIKKEDCFNKRGKAFYDVMVKELYSQSKYETPPVLPFVEGEFMEQSHPQDWYKVHQNAFIQSGYERADLKYLHVLTFPPTAYKESLEAVHVQSRKSSSATAWKQIASKACCATLPLYVEQWEFCPLGLSLWNMFVEGLSNIPHPEGNWKKFLGLKKAEYNHFTTYIKSLNNWQDEQLELIAAICIRKCRVLFIGETGTGKSTTINSLIGSDAVATSDNATGCTKDYGHVFHLRNNICYEFIDSVGLNEVTTGTVDQKKALKRFFAFLRDNAEGFNLIVFCMKQGRLTQQGQATYNIMVKGLYSLSGNEPPPVLLFVGGMFSEQERPQDWCNENRDDFMKAGFDEASPDVDSFHALCLPKSLNKMLENLYRPIKEESVVRAWEQIESKACLEMRPFYHGRWGFITLGMSLWNLFVRALSKIPHPTKKNLKEAFGLVTAIPEHIKKLIQSLGITPEEYLELDADLSKIPHPTKENLKEACGM